MFALAFALESKPVEIQLNHVTHDMTQLTHLIEWLHD